ncbi:unnamed protein product [Mytilus coruscus]|uniref:WSC domain-containing protein n=1 Tax=Mytilus coruscus TaxID=42192 RepID=A0A6J8DMZ9_MYTCO|nr:unnamed protein product [Mytilus coruscus]
MCSLAGIDNINNIDIFNESSDYMGINKVKKAWTGTAVKYTKWAAFIGCGRRYSSIDSERSIKTIEDCLRHCSGYSSSSYFVMKSSTCSCLTDKPETYDDINDCRATCTHPSNTPCQYGQSALVFAFVEAVLSKKSWYDYQEECLKEGIFVLYDRNTLGSHAHSNEIYWTPIFRSHTVSSGTAVERDFCIALSNAENRYFTIESCSTLLPFLCAKTKMESSKNGSESDITHHPLKALLTSVIIAAALLIILLIFMMIMISSKTLGRLRFYKEKLQKVNERLQGTEFSEYTGLEEINVEGNESGYRELSPNMQQLSTERHAHTPRDQLDHQGYLVPEQHYQTIQENLHYAETGITENTSIVPVN